MKHDEMIAVISAQRDGKIIERRCTDKGLELHKMFWKFPSEDLAQFCTGTTIIDEAHLRQWNVMAPETPFNFMFWDYRIKQESPEPRNWWIYPISGRSDCHIDTVPGPDLIHVREVLPEQ